MALRNIAGCNSRGLAQSSRLVVWVPLWLAACSTSSGGGTVSSTTEDSSETTSTTTATGAPSAPNSSSPAPVTPPSNSTPVTPTSPAPGTTTEPRETETTSAISSSNETSAEGPGPDAPTASGTSDQTGETEPVDATSAPTTSAPNSSEPEPTNPGDCQPTTDERAPVGYGAGTTGGGDAPPVIVTSFADAEAALEAYRDAFKDGAQSSLVLRYTGTFDYGTITDVCAQHTKAAQVLYIKEVDNVTFEGAAGSSANFGIKINRAKNVIVRNMTIGLLPGGGDSDAITIEGNGTNGDVEHVWIDHNNLFSDTKDDCDGAGDTEFDGLIDIKKGARYITLSYNHLHDHQKTGLLGSSDSDDMDRYVTFHHNWYENVVSRTPLHRFGYIHLFNNYFDRILDSGINVRMGGVALIESNYFENAANPITSRYSDVVGYWDLRDNHVGANVTWTLTEDTLANADDWESTTTFPAGELTYEYAPDTAECVKAIVTARAGATL
jgi:pectate lyase